MAYGTLQTDVLNTSTGVFSTNNAYLGICKAWVQFQGGNGNTAGTINGSFNVSSITVVGTGNYTVNYVTAMPNTNYAVAGVCNYSGVSNSVGDTIGSPITSTSNCTFYTGLYTGSNNVRNQNTVFFVVLSN